MWTMLTVMPRLHGCSCQGCKATNHTAELSRTFRTLPPEPTPRHTRTLGKLPTRLPTPTHTGTLRNLPEPSKTFRNPPFGTYASKHQNPPKSSGTFRNLPLRNLPEPAPGTYTGTFRNLRNPPPEPTPAQAGTLRNLPEPPSGTCSCDPHRHTPELIWAEDPSSLRCWGKKKALPIFWELNQIESLRLRLFHVAGPCAPSKSLLRL